MGILSPKQANYLGIDLSPDSIKVVELGLEQGKPKLVTYGYTEARSDVLQGDFITNKNLTSTLLKEVADQAKVTTNLAAAALPIASVFSSVVKLTKVIKRDLDNKPKIKSLLSVEVKKILPRPLEEMSFDFNLISSEEIEKVDRNTNLDVVKFLITAADNEMVKSYDQIFKQAGFSLSSLDIESFSLIRSLIGKDKSLIMIVDLGENRTNLTIVDLTIPVLNRSIHFGGAVVTRALADSLNIVIAEAENYKLDLGIMMSQQNMNKFPRVVEDSLAPIVTEIKYLLKTYYDQTGQKKILDKIILTGGSSLLGNNLDKYLTEVLNIRTYIGDPWARIMYPEELSPVLQEIGPRFSVALGLAMREII